jgi:serine/threonine protein kinase
VRDDDPSPVGRGSFGVVYRWESALAVGGEFVAVKVLSRDVGVGAGVRGGDRGTTRYTAGVAVAFATESSRLFTLRRHRNIVRVLGVLEHPSAIVMEYVQHTDGVCSMADWIANVGSRRAAGRDVTLVGDLLGMAVDVCRGMAFMHANGLIHCDLKPGNVLIDSRGHAKVTDVGGAVSVNQADGESYRPTIAIDHGVSFGTGTPGFMAPEQLMGMPREDDGVVTPFVCTRSDVWSFGVLLLQLFHCSCCLDGVADAWRVSDEVLRNGVHVVVGAEYDVSSDEEDVDIGDVDVSVDGADTADSYTERARVQWARRSDRLGKYLIWSLEDCNGSAVPDGLIPEVCAAAGCCVRM